MQVTQAEPKNSTRVGVEEEFIKFRPSPNFKNMKKFLKNRSDYTETKNSMESSVSTEIQPEVEQVQNRPQAQVQTRSQTLALSQTQKLEYKKEEVKPPVTVVQPPLPPYPPPPDSPSPLNIKIKQEKIDDDNPNAEESIDSVIQFIEQTQPEATPKEERPKKTICKEFIRGNCKRPVCKFAHEVDVSQLAGVYTFCWNYQNASCTYPNCRFVHATVFEEAEFYRTGILPPHARSHLKKQASQPEEMQPEIPPAAFVNPPPPLHSSVEKPLIPCIPAGAIEERPVVEDFRAGLPRSTSPLKREWSDIDEFSSSPRDIEANEIMAKKCNTCEIMEFRLQYNKEKVTNMVHSSDEINKKMAHLTKKMNKLSNVLLTLIKPSLQPSKGGPNSGFVGNDKDKALLEQLTSFANTNNRLASLINEENVKTIFNSNSNFTSLMSKFRYPTGDQSTAPDNSRET